LVVGLCSGRELRILKENRSGLVHSVFRAQHCAKTAAATAKEEGEEISESAVNLLTNLVMELDAGVGGGARPRAKAGGGLSEL